MNHMEGRTHDNPSLCSKRKRSLTQTIQTRQKGHSESDDSITGENKGEPHGGENSRQSVPLLEMEEEPNTDETNTADGIFRIG